MNQVSFSTRVVSLRTSNVILKPFTQAFSIHGSEDRFCGGRPSYHSSGDDRNPLHDIPPPVTGWRKVNAKLQSLVLFALVALTGWNVGVAPVLRGGGCDLWPLGEAYQDCGQAAWLGNEMWFQEHLDPKTKVVNQAFDQYVVKNANQYTAKERRMIRNVLREATKLPDEAARRYIRTHVKGRSELVDTAVQAYEAWKKLESGNLLP